MPQSRASGLLLIVMSALTFLGTTNQLLPAITFFPALAACALGVVVFVKANGIALAESEERTLRRLHPDIKNETAERAANRQAEVAGMPLAGTEMNPGRVIAEAAIGEQVQEDEIVLYEVDQHDANPPAANAPSAQDAEDDDPDFVVTTDVSFPLEVQQQTSLADQLAKLRRLTDDGILSEEEFAVAKAKILS